jgi:branched-chain amino acid transport system ATP-binding protein
MLAVDGLEVRYGRVPALAGVSLSVRRGELVTVVGPNGAGKTTLLRAIAGLVPPRAGTIALEGAPIAGWPPEAVVAAGLVTVPEGRELFGPLTVRENLLLGAFRHSRRHRLRHGPADLDRVLALFPPLAQRLAIPAARLSGGEQQMLAIGRALMARPRLLLLDEPSVGLAPLVIAEIFRVIEGLRAEGLTMILVEQNARAAFRLADRGYALGPGGRLVEPGGAHAADTARRAYGLRVAREESAV